MAEPILRVEGLCKYFGSKKAVDDVSFSIERGEVFGLVGESGCGKTTTGRCIINLYDITAGTITFDGKVTAAGTGAYLAKIREDRKSLLHPGLSTEEKKRIRNDISENRRLIQEANRIHKDVPRNWITRIQMIYQDPIASLDPRMTVYDIIAEGLRIRGIRDRKTIDEKVYGILDRVGLVREHAGRYPHEFSGGQRQRIGVARAVVMDPAMIIADEPVSALDVSIQAQVINLLSDLRHELGLTVLFIAHDLSVVKYFSDRIGVMYYGHLVELASSDELFAHPIHPYTRALLSAVPLPDPLYEQHRVRILYDPSQSGMSEAPQFRELLPNHFVRCTEREAQTLLQVSP